MQNFKNWLLLFFVILAFILFYAFDLEKYFTFSALQSYHEILKDQVESNLFLSILLFGILYGAVTASSLPIAAFLMVLGGFLFGPYISVIVVDISATLGACLLFLILKSTLGEILEMKAIPWIKKTERVFEKNAFSYLLFLRLVPFFPFWAVNIVAACLRVPLGTFFLATLLGIIPAVFIYSFVGNEVGVLLAQDQAPDLSIIFRAEILLPLCGLAFLSLLPIFFKKERRT